jgi:hypothetical protein
MADIAVVMLVGPGQKEIDRTADTLDSIWAHEPHVAWCVLIDDSLHDRDLARRFSIPPTTNTVSIMNPRYGRGIGIGGGCCTGLLSALSWIHKHTNAPFSLKLDTDALVIAPFVQKIQRAFDAMPEVGMLGSYDIGCDGSKRDFSGWGREARKWSAPLNVSRNPAKLGRYLRFNLWGRPAIIRSHIQTALAQGYQLGEHCLGGAYAVSGEMISRMAAKGYFDDPVLWRDTTCGEDVMLGMYTRAVGLMSKSLVAQNEPFGIRHVGLADTPENLLAKGYSFIHSLKNDRAFSEEYIRAFFAERRLTGAPLSRHSPPDKTEANG